MSSTETDRSVAGMHENRVHYTADLAAKAAAFTGWLDARVRAGGFAYAKRLTQAPGPCTALRYADGMVHHGHNFSSQDYLGLGSHPEIVSAARHAIARFGVHSAGATAQAGAMELSDELEAALAAHLDMPFITLFPTGWAAGFGVTRALLRSTDHAIVDVQAHNCLQEGAAAATRNVHYFRHLDTQHARDKLAAIRATHPHSGILVATSGLFGVDALAPELVALQASCREFDALLLVDVSHDLGATGPDGTGQIGVQSLHGKVDLVMGSFAKAFASNGGFVATHRRHLREYFRFHAPTNTFSNALAPAQLAAVLAALTIVRSPEGERRRAGLFAAANVLRAGLVARQVEVLGLPGPIVPAMIGRDDVARVAAQLAAEAGVLANLIEYPIVARHAARFRLQLMSTHEPVACESAARVLAGAIVQARATGAQRPVAA